MTAAERIREATYADVDRLVRCLTRAFDDDPLINWLVRQDDKRPHGFEVFFHTCLATVCLPSGQVLTTDDRTGCLLWFPPGTYDMGLARQVSLLPNIFRVTSLRGLKRMVSTMDALDKAHPKQEHAYMLFAGVEPECQRQGLGSALTRRALEQCDRAGWVAYLESTRATTIPHAERLGFRVTGVIDLGPGAPRLWSMWREPPA